uniref:Multidrug resistance protein, MATE family n=1 Tax=Candidatus Kentrum sp. DK TaxID=2126562 RepID=A0A450SY69_9GAMM|nr:MAG: multidrug resistance protein, MATE family [Candidatus Kentron sp. DK]
MLPVISELRTLLKISLPLAFANLGWVATGVTDSIFIGRLGPDVLGATGLALSVFFIIRSIGGGMLFPVMVLVSQARGADQLQMVPEIVRQGIWVAGMISVPGCAILWNMESMLIWASQDTAIVQLAGQYMDYYLWTMFPSLASHVFILALIAMERTGRIAFVTWFLMGLNIILDYVLIFGKLGLPAMGVAGAGLASLIVSGIWLVLFGLLAAHIFSRSGNTLFYHTWRPRWTMVGKILRLGWPKGLGTMMERGLSSVIVFLAGLMGVQAISSHAIAFQIYLLVSVVVLMAVAGAVTTRMGVAHGQGNRIAMWGILNGGFGLLLLFMLPLMIVFWGFPELVVILFVGSETPEARAIVPLASSLVMVSGLYVIVYGVCFVIGNALNGLSDMKIPTLLAASIYWGICLPSAAIFGFLMDWGILGLWAGLIVGMAILFLSYLVRFRVMVRRL